MNRGHLLVLEGLDGCGKSTQAERLGRALRAAGRDVVLTSEPTGGPHGRRIREMARSGRVVPAEDELRWFVDDRREHVDAVIAPGLEAGRVVLTDRYFLSTVAYQGARGLPWREILADSEARFPLPDLVVLLEVDPEVGLERVRARGGALEVVFEARARLEQVAAIFREIDRPYLERIDGGGDADAVGTAVIECVRRRVGLL